MTTTATQKFTILAADKLAKEGLDWVSQQSDAELLNKPGLTEQEYADMLAAGGIQAMIVRSGIKVTAAMLENPGDLKVIARAGVGVDNIDLQAATAKGVLVVNTAEASTVTTAEHAFTLMCSLARQVGPASRTMYEGGWDRSKFKGVQLAGKTLGVVGFGRIGQTLATRAMAFDMEVLAYDPFIAASTMLDGKVKMFRDFEEMLPQCDIVSFHVPLNDQTRGMLGPDQFAKAKPGLLVVNAARGGVVDENAIIPAIEAGQCGGAALDVFTSEPPAEDLPLRTHPKVLCTPHLGASTVEAQQAVSVDAGAACLAYLRGEGIKGAVNAGNLRVDLNDMQQAFVDLAGRMATIISPMITRGISEVVFELRGEDIHAAAGTIERAALVNLFQGHLDDPVNVINVVDVAKNRGINIRCNKVNQDTGPSPQMTVEIVGPPEAVDSKTAPADMTRRIVGRVYDDMLPRIVEINRYHMDMVPTGDMVMIQNDDKPGMISVVSTGLAQADVNIADMSISRRTTADGKTTALMVIKVDTPPSNDTLSLLRSADGILKVAQVKLPSCG